MSVYKRQGADTFSYDFRLGGRRFLGETGERSKRKARAAEGIARAAARQHLDELAKLNAPQTWSEASSRWFNEIGAHHVQIEQTLASLVWLEREIGKNRPLTQIDDNLVARLVAKRRLEKRRGKGWKSDAPISAATVNRTVTEPMRKVMLRAQRVWRVPVGDVDWRKHMLAEPRERVREATPDEEAGILAKLERGYDDAVTFAFVTGCRSAEIIGLLKSKVDFFNRQFTVTGKGRKERTIPMTSEAFDMLWRKRNEPTDFAFTYIAKRTTATPRRVRGEHYPLTESGFRIAVRRAIDRAGVPNFRRHDTRHTAATRVLRTSNTRVVQKMLGHASITTTEKYAHVTNDDIRAAMEAARPAKFPAVTTSATGKVLKENGD